MRGGDSVIFDDKTFSDLLKDIYFLNTDKRIEIKGIILQLTPLIKSVGDAITVAPIIKDLLEVSVKNDEQLLKIAAVVQKIISADINSQSENSDEMLTEEEKERLMKNSIFELREIEKEINNASLTITNNLPT